MTENNQSEQGFHSAEEAGISKDQLVHEEKKKYPYDKHIHIPLDPREDYFKNK